MKRDLSVETLRGLAIFLVVLFHVSESEPLSERLVLSSLQLKRALSPFLLVRMPLFAAISGYVFALSPFGKDRGLLRLLADRAARLLLPFTSVLTLTLAARLLLGGTKGGITDRSPLGLLSHYVYGFEHLWYLQASFVIVASAVVLQYAGALATFARWSAVLAASSALPLLLPPIYEFSLDRAFYLAPFFLLGIGLARFPERIVNRAVLAACLVLVVAGVFIQQYTFSAGLHELATSRSTPLALLVGVASLPLCFRFRRVLPLFPALAYYSYTIYLFHFFGISAANRVVRWAFHSHGYAVHVAVGLALALCLPIALHHLVVRSATLSWLFLGRGRKPDRDRASNPKGLATRPAG